MAFDICFTQWDDSIMSVTVSLDKAGRIVIPKPLRDELHLGPGDELEVTPEGDSLTLRPVRATSRLRKKHGIWVFGGTGRITTDETNAVLRGIREQRERQAGGDDR